MARSLCLATALALAALESCSCEPRVGTRTPAACGAPVCESGSVRCQDACVRVLRKGDRCSPALDCAGGLCEAGTVCHAFLGGYVCAPGKPLLAACTPGGDECAVGGSCAPVEALRPRRPGDPAGFCVAWALEGQRCAGVVGGTIGCEPGLSCRGGACRKTCATDSDCPCGRAEHCFDGAVVSPGAGPGLACFGCADWGGAKFPCDAQRPCCSLAARCLPDAGPGGGGTCCAGAGRLCGTGLPCCPDHECAPGPEGRDVCTACVPQGGACRDGERCCGGKTCCGGRCVDPACPDGQTLDDQSCQCVTATCANTRRCPDGSRPDAVSCRCKCPPDTPELLCPCPGGTRFCGADRVPACVDFRAPCPPACTRSELLRACGPGETCCGSKCFEAPYGSCCSDDYACPVDFPVCCVAKDRCCVPGTADCCAD